VCPTRASRSSSKEMGDAPRLRTAAYARLCSVRAGPFGTRPSRSRPTLSDGVRPLPTPSNYR
jgi:hypothetical protein